MHWTVTGTRCDVSGEVYGAVVFAGHIEYVAMAHSDQTHQFVFHVVADNPVAALDEVGC